MFGLRYGKYLRYAKYLNQSSAAERCPHGGSAPQRVLWLKRLLVVARFPIRLFIGRVVSNAVVLLMGWTYVPPVCDGRLALHSGAFFWLLLHCSIAVSLHLCTTCAVQSIGVQLTGKSRAITIGKAIVWS
jgi:hypothetical protein